MKVGLTVSVAKMAAGLSRITGRGNGQALPGLVAERFDSSLAAKLAAELPNGVILITGTNGKTTTTKLLAAMLTESGERVLVNRTGSNLKRGVTSALIAASDWQGHLYDFTIGIFEVDEASLRQVAAELQPSHIVVLNLFRDQLDRYGELDTTARMIGEGIATTKSILYLNADDPLVASLAKYASNVENVRYFGVEGLPVAKSSPGKTAVDSDRCPICREALHFERVFYGHIGHYRCPRGHFTRPQPGVVITNVVKADTAGSRFTVSIEGKRSEANLPLPGTYNMYNALAALAVAHGLGVDDKQSVATLTTSTPAFGRVEQIELRGRTLYLLLIKNPAGFSQVLETFLLGQKEVNVLMAVNDLPADGRDVSWLWDVPLESLASGDPNIVSSGIRAKDMALRLKYAGIESLVEEKFDDAIEKLLENTPENGTAYILPTYTAMLDIRKMLSKLTQIPEMGE